MTQEDALNVKEKLKEEARLEVDLALPNIGKDVKLD